MRSIKSIDQLTSLRFFAAAAIVFLHSKGVFEATKDVQSPIPLDFGVSFFFVLSGFILTYNYRDLRSKGQILEYFGARVSRIWPVHLFTFALVLLLIPQPFWTAAGAASHVPSVTILNVLLLHAWVPLSGYFFSYNGVSWSISTELFFYLAFPFLIRNWARTWHYKSLFVLAVSFGLVAAAQSLKLPLFNGQSPLMVSSNGIVYISPLVRIAEFLCGIWAATIFVRMKHEASRPTLAGTLVEIGALAAIYFVGTLCMGVIQSSSSLDALQIYLGSSGGALAFSLAILIMACGKGWISRVLAIKPLVLLGQASFALYMTHQLVILFVYLNKAKYFAAIPDILLLSLYWLGCIALSIAIYFGVEQPCRRRLRALFQPRQPANASAPAS